MLDYFTSKKAKSTAQQEKLRKNSQPLLTDEDEAFLHRITSQAEETPPPLPARPLALPVAGETEGNTSQLVLLDTASNVPLPEGDGHLNSPQPVPADEAGTVPLPDVPDTPQEPPLASPKESLKSPTEAKKKRWSWFKHDKHKGRKATGSEAGEASNSNAGAVTAGEVKKEKDEIEQVLEQLNLAAVNNTVFSISDESRDLLRNFTLVFKDLVNGVPTAYHDLEALITNSESQLQKMWLGLPPFLQQLVAKLPTKFSQSMGPEVLAAAAEKQGLKAEMFTKASAASAKPSIKFKIPELKDLVGKKGALTTMFRSIVNSLRSRFPAVLGLNVLWSVAIAVLLLLCWYCHKRGKEVRLEQERALTEAEMAEIKAMVEADPPAEWSESMTTLAPEGAPITEVRESLAPASSAHPEYAQGGSLAKALREEAEAKAEAEAEAKKKEEAAGKGKGKETVPDGQANGNTSTA